MIVVLRLLLLCACSRTYGASSRELGERHALCDILLFLLLQLRLLRLLRVSASTYCRRRRRRCCCCCLLSWISSVVLTVDVFHVLLKKLDLPEAANDHYKIKWVSRKSAFFWTCRAVVRIYLGSSFSVSYLLACILSILKFIRFFFVSVIW